VKILDAYATATETDHLGAVMLDGEMIDEATRKMAAGVAERGRAAGLQGPVS
jgi:citrate lyase subunit beta/citryl-CoA lyase